MKLKTPWVIIRFSICITRSVAGPEPFRVEIFWLEPVRWFSNQRKMEKNCKKTKNMFLMLIIQVFTNTFIFIYFFSEYSVGSATGCQSTFYRRISLVLAIDTLQVGSIDVVGSSSSQEESDRYYRQLKVSPPSKKLPDIYRHLFGKIFSLHLSTLLFNFWLSSF